MKSKLYVWQLSRISRNINYVYGPKRQTVWIVVFSTRSYFRSETYCHFPLATFKARYIQLDCFILHLHRQVNSFYTSNLCFSAECARSKNRVVSSKESQIFQVINSTYNLKFKKCLCNTDLVSVEIVVVTNRGGRTLTSRIDILRNKAEMTQNNLWHQKTFLVIGRIIINDPFYYNENLCWQILLISVMYKIYVKIISFIFNNAVFFVS